MFIKGRRPTSEKNFRPTASCIFRPGTFWENDLTKKTIIKTKTMKMTYSFREYLQRANLETLTFYKYKDIWNTLRCILNPFVIFLPHPIIQIYMRCTVAESILKTSCYWKVLLKIYFMFNLFPFPSPHLIIEEGTSSCYSFNLLLHRGLFWKLSRDFITRGASLYSLAGNPRLSRWQYIFLDGIIFF